MDSETITKPAIKPFAFTYGAYLGFLSILSLIIMYILKIDKSIIMSVVSIILTVTIYYLAINAFKKANNTYLSLGDAIKVGLAVAAVSGLIAAVYTFIHYSFIYPEYIEMIREKGYEEMMAQNPSMTGEAKDMAIKMMKMFTSVGFFSTIMIVSSLIFGLIISLILGLILKKDNNHY